MRSENRMRLFDREENAMATFACLAPPHNLLLLGYLACGDRVLMKSSLRLSR